MTKQQEVRIETTARYLGYAGLLPFISALVVLVLVAEPALRELTLRGVVTYAALIITFVSAIQWGMAIQTSANAAPRHLVMAVIPSLVAWGLLFLPFKAALLALFFGFLSWHGYERLCYQQLNYPQWLQQLRAQLSHCVSGCLLLIWLLSLFNFSSNA